MSRFSARRRFLRTVVQHGGFRRHARLETAAIARAGFAIEDVEDWYLSRLEAGEVAPDRVDFWWGTLPPRPAPTVGIARPQGGAGVPRRQPPRT